MTTMTGKGDPEVVSAALTDTRIVRLTLGNPSRTADDTGHVFLPDMLHLEYRNGDLSFAAIGGPRLREDGQPWLLSPVRSLLMFRPSAACDLDPNTPGWVLALVKEHAPA